MRYTTRNYIIKHISRLFKIVGLLLFTHFYTLGQAVIVPDTAFRRMLSEITYVDLIDDNGRLVIAQAAKLGGVLNGTKYPKITSVEGVQYFTGIEAITFVGTSLTVIPDISSLKQLQRINLNENALKVLPDLSKLKRLNTLTIRNNQLSHLPDLSQNDSLVELNVNNNLLDSMPDLSRLVLLKRLIVHANRLKELKGIEKLKSLVEFLCDNNQLGNFPKLDQLKAIETFRASNNQLTSAPDFGLNSPIQNLYLQQNNIAFLPDYKTYTNLKKVNLQNNKLTFTQLVKILPITRYDTVFQLSPQQIIKGVNPLSLKEGDSFVFRTGVDTTVNNVKYNWYVNGKSAASVSQDKWTVPYIHLYDSGQYTTQLTHPSFANFNLQREAFRVSVSTCVDFTSLSITSTEINCRKTATLDVVLPGAVTYQLKGISSGKMLTSTTGRFIGLSETAYNLSVITSTGCSKTYPKEVKIAHEKCSEYLITPDNDGNADVFYFEASGKAEIYDKRGNMVRKISIPGEWNCFSETGKVPTGYYIAIINEGESRIGLSVVY